MAHPTLQILTVLELLQVRGRVSGADLARRLGVDRRTVRRYIARLEELGVPITAEHGRAGAYMLVSGFKLPPMMFTDEEAIALSIGLLACRWLGVTDAPVAAASAEAKLERVMPASVKQRMSAVADTVMLDLTRPVVQSHGSHLAAFTAAAQGRTRLTVVYRNRAQDRTQRDVDPYGIAYSSGCWYAVGMCHLRHDLRSFRLDRVESIRPTGVSFTRPERFDAVEYLKHALAVLPRRYSVEVLLKAEMASAHRHVFAAFGVLEPVPGGVLLRSQTDDLDWFARELARLPFDYEIRQPDELRDAVGALARRLLSALTTDPHRGS
jgi:predicted DNA-binding transcriptional regulator YafY